MIQESDSKSGLSPLIEAARAEGFFSKELLDCQPLCQEGSDRSFFRIRQAGSSWVALVSPRKNQEGTDENDSYLRIGNHLFRRHVPVPQILWSDTARGFFLLEDVGDHHMQRRACGTRTNVKTLYEWAIGLLIHMHRKAPQGFDPSFCFDTVLYDPAFVYARELEYFRKAFILTYLGEAISEEDFRQDFENLAEDAGAHKTSLIMHRDFQSRNIMIHRGTLRLIDFQGMRFGPPVYDLASLLVDPYVRLARGVQESILELYWLGAKGFLDCTYRQFMESYTALRLCRNLQALGAYGYLGVTKGKTQFLSYIPRAWAHLLEWINGPCRGRYPVLQAWINSVDRAGLLTRKVGS